MKGNEKRAYALFSKDSCPMLHKGNTKHIQNDNNKQENEIETI